MADNQHEIIEPVEQDTVALFGRTVVAVRLPDGRVAAVFTDLCQALDLDRASQARRVRADDVIGGEMLLANVLLVGDTVPHPSDVLTAWAVPVWLQGIQLSRLSVEKRPAILAFKREAANVLYQHFSQRGPTALPQVEGLLPTPAPAAAAAATGVVVPAADAAVDAQAQVAIAQVVAQIGDLSAVVNLLREHLAGLLGLPAQVEGLSEQVSQAMVMLGALSQRQQTTDDQLAQIDARTQRLTPTHARAVQELVTRIVRATAHLPAPAPLTYTILYGRLKHRFRAGSYAEIPDHRYDDVLAFLHGELRRATGGDTPEQGTLL